MSVPGESSAWFASAARALQDQRDTQSTLDRSALLATELIPSCEYATIATVHRNGAIDTSAATDHRASLADQLQYQLNEGPCLEAIRHRDAVISHDLGQEDRWPRWSPTVASDLGLRSTLCLQLFTTAFVLGGLNLYSTTVNAFNDEDLSKATSFAAHVAVAVAEAQTADELRTSADSRTVIGQAQGILMERYAIDGQQAFQVLRRVSQKSHTKLARIAEELVQTRKLTELEPPMGTDA